MQMIPVNSSAISAIGYDQQTRRMKITFKETGTYDFCRVPQSIFDGLKNAFSKGSYYNNNIRDKYPC